MRGTRMHREGEVHERVCVRERQSGGNINGEAYPGIFVILEQTLEQPTDSYTDGCRTQSFFLESD